MVKYVLSDTPPPAAEGIPNEGMDKARMEICCDRINLFALLR